MDVNGPLVFGLLVALGVVIAFIAMWQITRSRDPVEARLEEYGLAGQEPISADSDAYGAQGRRALSGINRLLAGFGFGPRLAVALARADVPLTAAEFALIMAAAATLGFLLGTVRLGPLVGLGMGLLLGYLPMLYLRFKHGRRLRAFTEQLPEVLTLLVGGLRAGYGLNQAIELLVDELPPPASTEFARVMRAVGFGLPLQKALSDMAERVGSDDLDLVVTAITVQYEMGGNLAHTMETIGETVRDRLRILREIRVLTSQQRLTGYLLALLPVVMAIILFIIRPEYMRAFLEPGFVRLLPFVAVVLQVLGFVIIRRIVDIEV